MKLLKRNMFVFLGVLVVLVLLARNPVVTIAAGVGNFALMKAAITLGGNVNNAEGGPLFNAISSNNYDVTKYLVDAGADVNQKPIIDDTTVDDTPLFAAVRSGNEDIVQLMLWHGAEVNERDEEEYTPLIWAAFYGKARICRILMSFGASTKSKTKSGMTVLDAALESKDEETIAIFTQPS